MLKLISSTNIIHVSLSSPVALNADDGPFLLNTYHIVAVREELRLDVSPGKSLSVTTCPMVAKIGMVGFWHEKSQMSVCV